MARTITAFPRIAFACVLSLAFGLAVPAMSAGLSPGDYLAASQARSDADFAAAGRYYELALAADPENIDLMDNLVQAQVALGQFDAALPVVERLVAADAHSASGAIVRIVTDANAGRWQAIVEGEAAGKLAVEPLLDALVAAWAELGAGRAGEAFAAFDTIMQSRPARPFGLYHKALALAVAGDLEAADAILSGENGERLTLTRRGIFARAEILSQLGRDADALGYLSDAFGTGSDPALAAMRTRLERGETLPLTIVTTPAEGLAEVFFTIAATVRGGSDEAFLLGFTRAAEALQPGHVDAILMSADLFIGLGQYALAIASYDRVPADSPYADAAALGRADTLIRSGQADAGIAALEELGEAHPKNVGILVTLGDALRQQERYADAKAAYDRAIALFDIPDEGQWPVYFARGVSEERTNDWPGAEADLRRALELRPDQPQVLNYLGYSWVDKGENLDEALDMIRRAVKARPTDGYIVDSLGWAYYRLGRYREAVTQMERAVELVAVDPVITDHLGDVYWAVGRKREAEFQWSRALSFEPEDADAARIRRKLAVGLDEVLKEEGAKPLALAREG